MVVSVVVILFVIFPSIGIRAGIGSMSGVSRFVHQSGLDSSGPIKAAVPGQPGWREGGGIVMWIPSTTKLVLGVEL